jgi:hypothetical protein
MISMFFLFLMFFAYATEFVLDKSVEVVLQLVVGGAVAVGLKWFNDIFQLKRVGKQITSIVASVAVGIGISLWYYGTSATLQEPLTIFAISSLAYTLLIKSYPKDS